MMLKAKRGQGSAMPVRSTSRRFDAMRAVSTPRTTEFRPTEVDTPRVGAAPEVVDLPIAAIAQSPALRAGGVDSSHVATLAELVESWPPIVVRLADYTVIDGRHRLAAAACLGLDHIRAVLFDGTTEDAYVEFVRRNVGHGLPLSVDERRAAVLRILEKHSGRSDRSIAELCGVSPKTVARMRDSGGRLPENEVRAGRGGRDGRVRPVDAAGQRDRIAAELERQPDASLRAIARAVGASPETVRSVKNRLASGTANPEPGVPPALDAEAIVVALLARDRPIARQWQDDSALITCDGGQKFVEWFDETSVDATACWEFAGVVPLSRVYEVADEARRRSALWTSFADTLEGQIRRRA